MADSINPVGSPSRMSSSALLPARHDADARPRNRRLISTADDPSTGSMERLSASFSALHTPSSRDPSPMPSGHLPRDSSAKPNARNASADKRRNNTSPFSASFLDTSWSQGWASIQGLASSILSGGSVHDAGYESDHREGRQSVINSLKRDYSTPPRKTPKAWGPEPPSSSRPGHQDIATGSLAERDTALKAARTASVLESHEGVNGGLDVAGRYKRRNSDEVARDAVQDDVVQDQLVYIHHVQPTDTYAGIVLKYRCREDAFRKANGLWSRDIQVRKWLAIPVDACEIKGRPCEPPSHDHQGVDFLAPTPETRSAHCAEFTADQSQQVDFFSLPISNGSASGPKSEEQEELPWTHVRWVTLDSNTKPVEIARVSRKSIGYFPPRRKKSLRSASTLSTPRHSLDAVGIAAGFSESPEQVGRPSSRRQSNLSNRPNLPSTPGRSTPASSRSRMNSDAGDTRPAWMRRPGGVGSMGRSVRAPGPDKDYFNTWAKKHLPGIAIDESLPSISVMGSETANFGFRPGSSSGIVESPFDEGQDLAATSRQGSGLDRAAAAVETWLRGAFAKSPGTPTLGGRGRHLDDLDLIELTDTNSDDGRLPTPAVGGGVTSAGMLEATPMTVSSTARSDGDSSVRGRGLNTASIAKGKKSD
ncbi:LysM domain-containing protein [Colletotrichum truncatum]|uniref:LysM domain-containing protein n=1 Tax=Colletotrichum truncatum TaxID=5467 RepID=A0ACC3ZJ85_COLTU|nr:LysM domain-containing protein [Colletotrichum truncatum]KAF6782394.1 LysM domain-containing protein [Colletotrichum truncatum]